MKSYSKGRRAEHELRHILENSGWRVIRSAGSKGVADLVAFNKQGAVRMIQVKYEKANKSYLKELKELLEMQLLYPAFRWELWVRKDGGEFKRLES